MARRYKEKARTTLRCTLASLDYAIKRMEGQETARYHCARYNQKRSEEHTRLHRRVYQTGEWWLLTDVYERLQAKAYFTIVNRS